MFKSRAMNLLFTLMVLVIIGMIVVFFFVFRQQSDGENKGTDIDEIVNQLTVDTGEITTNIKGDHFIKLDFNIQVSSKEAKEELEKRTFQVKNAVIYTVSGMTPEDLQDQQGIAQLESLIKKRVDGFLQSGTVTHVYTTEKIVQ
ncbi:flagellar basal body-associated FliL family protein [Sporolactobacillus terrae]|uniref:Flagellar protein FliL n=1 Tax=Sporolactobacillus terrae TaxID=269673 RepID=A0A410D8G2_9BACL|nr:flagellar basal body-associated FliL family protein [Sporolactobacillus terrae]QAA22348.1 flagellar basal body-associated protein FliL [Sporolactobacillus terrae]QAA25324.1 flagellar basal body-associated protein FliL [Sporolactobacillus terrae]UAK17134.1 flagellar basal body-associated FliL family protein [Sporolactobacillus terrae]BBN98664.1 flagellar protein FliL [Sporolactobacillus terrae]